MLQWQADLALVIISNKKPAVAKRPRDALCH